MDSIGVVGFCFGGWISNMMAVKFKFKSFCSFYGGATNSRRGSAINTQTPLNAANMQV